MCVSTTDKNNYVTYNNIVAPATSVLTDMILNISEYAKTVIFFK